ncbi:MAG: AAA family ATPase [Acidobacteriota bacterium]|nr:AAA family ATPase [Acidobacteriota bacterium]
MNSFPIPQPPNWQLDWQSIHDRFEFVRSMQGCNQEPSYHAEGDVWIHTRMVCESLASNQHWRMLPEEERRIVFIASLMHDVAKPVCTRLEDGRLTSRGHSSRGEIIARVLLWQMETPMRVREQIASLIRWHQVPFFLIESNNSLRRLIEVSQTARCDLLALVTESDGRGRICEGQQRLLDNISLFEQFAAEEQCLRQPRQFPSDHSRFLYFRKEDRNPNYSAYDDTTCEVILMSGLPGAGKDHWIATQAPDWPVISLDALRREMKIAPTDKQGAVIARAKETAREYLRRKQSFIWNATNFSRQMRELSLSLCAAYKARVRIVYVETSESRLLEQNREREHSVPPAVIERMLAKWQVPDLTEAHQVQWVES